LVVGGITIRDDRPGENTMIAGRAERLIDRVAVWNAGRQAEKDFGHLLPSWASSRDREGATNEILAEGISETSEIKKKHDEGSARARELLNKYKHEVCRLAAHVIEHRHMDAADFECFMEGVER
jgi:hypothetical protein